MVEIISMAAMTKDGVIGRDNRIPWDIPEELKFFRSTTKGWPVIMGRKTHDSIGRVLPGRVNIVISRSMPEKEGVVVCRSVEEAVREAAALGREKVFNIGGATIYGQAMPFTDKLYISYIHDDYEGDTYFPEIDMDVWEVESRDEREKYTFVVYRRKNGAAARPDSG